jgi:hypothetical protein
MTVLPITAYMALQAGKSVRCTRWSPSCWVTARQDAQTGEYTIVGLGSPRWIDQIDQDAGIVLRELLMPGFRWEVMD